MSNHLTTQNLSACLWAVIVVTSGCGLILLALNSPTLTGKHHQQANAPTEDTLLVKAPNVDRSLQSHVVETGAVTPSERND